MKKYFSIIILMTGLIFASCNSYLEIAPPNAIIEEQVLELLGSGNTTRIDQILGGLAGGLPGTFKLAGIYGTGTADPRHYTVQGLDVMRNLEGNDVVLGDMELGTLFGNDEYKLMDFIATDNGKNFPYWYGYWANITAANKLLYYLTPEIVGNNPRADYYRALAYTVHAWFYNYLMENYQDAYMQGGKDKLGMMWYDKWDPKASPQARLSAQETYAKMAAEIKEAVRVFESLGAAGYTASTTDIDLGVAAFVQARIALCMGDWATAISACDKILAKNDKLMDETQYVNRLEDDGIYRAKNGFLDNALNPEVLIGWPANTSLKAGYPIYRNIFGTGQGGLSQGFYRIDKRLYNQINDNDYRKDNFLKEGVTIDYLYPPDADGRRRTIPDYSNLKFSCMYGIGGTAKTTWDQVCDHYMRVSEVYLMKAEAQLKSGKEADAKATLNILLAARTRKDATPLTCDNYAVAGKTYTTEQLIQLQTRIEMWGERGLEFYNNKRWNIRIDRTGNETNHTAKVTYEVSRMTLAIPKTETDYNPLCVQN